MKAGHLLLTGQPEGCEYNFFRTRLATNRRRPKVMHLSLYSLGGIFAWSGTLNTRMNSKSGGMAWMQRSNRRWLPVLICWGCSGLGCAFHSSDIKGAGTATCEELRVQHAGRPYRVLYAFDFRRCAVLLIGGDKTAQHRWYHEYVPLAEKLYDVHLDSLRKEGRDHG